MSATAQAIGRYAWATAALSLAGVFALPSGGCSMACWCFPSTPACSNSAPALGRDPNDPQRARSLFRWSILYLFGICLLLVMARSTQAGLHLSRSTLLGLGLADALPASASGRPVSLDWPTLAGLQRLTTGLIELQHLSKRYGASQGPAGPGPGRPLPERAAGGALWLSRPQWSRQDHRPAHPLHPAGPR